MMTPGICSNMTSICPWLSLPLDFCNSENKKNTCVPALLLRGWTRQCGRKKGKNAPQGDSTVSEAASSFIGWHGSKRATNSCQQPLCFRSHWQSRTVSDHILLHAIKVLWIHDKKTLLTWTVALWEATCAPTIPAGGVAFDYWYIQKKHYGQCCWD